MLIEAVLVDIVSKVVTPRATRAGTAFGSIQNENLNTRLLLHIGASTANEPQNP